MMRMAPIVAGGVATLGLIFIAGDRIEGVYTQKRHVAEEAKAAVAQTAASSGVSGSAGRMGRGWVGWPIKVAIRATA